MLRSPGVLVVAVNFLAAIVPRIHSTPTTHSVAATYLESLLRSVRLAS
jgi:hypothetical protein